MVGVVDVLIDTYEKSVESLNFLAMQILNQFMHFHQKIILIKFVKNLVLR